MDYLLISEISVDIIILLHPCCPNCFYLRGEYTARSLSFYYTKITTEFVKAGPC